MADNIASIRAAVKFGRHSTLYYPASGTDILRPLYAYDVSHLIAVDDDLQRVGETERQLRQLGIEPKVVVENNRRTISFELDGKRRQVTEVLGDVRIVSPQALGLETVDILHIYAPTGAEIPIREDDAYLMEKYGINWHMHRGNPDSFGDDAPEFDKDGEYREVAGALKNSLNKTNYEMVTEDGFFVFEENPLGGGFMSPSLLELTGLEQIEIVERHPWQVLTSFFPKASELGEKTRKGYIYKKAKTVDSRIFDNFGDAMMTGFWIDYGFMEFERGNWWGIGIENPDDVGGSIDSKYAGLKKDLNDLSNSLTASGADPQLIKRFVEDSLGSFRKRLLESQEKFRELLVASEDVWDRHQSGDITNEQAIEEMGIVITKDKSGEVTQINDTKWKLASQLLLYGQERSDEVQSMIQVFANSDFKLE